MDDSKGEARTAVRQSPQSGDQQRKKSMTVSIDTAEQMRGLGQTIAQQVHGGDVIVLSGPLGAGKTTFAQGFARGLGVTAPIVSPTFTIARELPGQFADGSPAKLMHVDAYRLGSVGYEPGQDSVDRLLDELESLGLDEALTDPGSHGIVLMEWGGQMAAALADERLEIHIDRPAYTVTDLEALGNEGLTSEGTREVSINAVGARWEGFVSSLYAKPV